MHKPRHVVWNDRDEQHVEMEGENDQCAGQKVRKRMIVPTVAFSHQKAVRCSSKVRKVEGVEGFDS